MAQNTKHIHLQVHRSSYTDTHTQMHTHTGGGERPHRSIICAGCGRADYLSCLTERKCKGFSLLESSMVELWFSCPAFPVEEALWTDFFQTDEQGGWHSFAKIYLGVPFIEESHTRWRRINSPCWNWRSTWLATIKAFGLLAVAQDYEKYLIFKNTQWYHKLAAGSKTVQLNLVYLKCSVIVYFPNANIRVWE